MIVNAKLDFSEYKVVYISKLRSLSVLFTTERHSWNDVDSIDILVLQRVFEKLFWPVVVASRVMPVWVQWQLHGRLLSEMNRQIRILMFGYLLPIHKEISTLELAHYRPQRSWGKVMFLHVCVILFTGGMLSQHALQVVSQHALQQVSRGGCLVPGGVCSQGSAWSRRGLLPGVPGGDPQDGYCCRRYASYWNAFLFLGFKVRRYRLLYTISNNIEVYELPVKRTKKNPQHAIKFEADEENKIVYEILYCYTYHQCHRFYNV